MKRLARRRYSDDGRVRRKADRLDVCLFTPSSDLLDLLEGVCGPNANESSLGASRGNEASIEREVEATNIILVADVDQIRSAHVG
eukprot:XP_001709097.1 Hypothetical protein GL50803_39044 [Giardia lamblia ATCC 50803]